MILQTDDRLKEERPPIGPYGCAFMSMCFLANKHLGYKMGIVEIVEIYDDLVERRVMSSDCFINDWQSMAKFFGFAPAVGKTVHQSALYICEDKEIEILLFSLPRGTGKVWKHFVAGNGSGVVTFDPWGVSLTATTGELEDKRIFSL